MSVKIWKDLSRAAKERGYTRGQMIAYMLGKDVLKKDLEAVAVK